MSWLFSQALVGEYSAGICSDGELSAPSSGNHMQLAYLSHGKTTEFSRLSRFGMTFKHLTEDLGEGLLTSYLAGFRAKTLAQLAQEKELKENAVECGSTWPALSVKYDQVSSSWKTAHCLWEEDLPWSSVTLPTWGMTRNGFVFRHPTAERPISEIAAGLWATPSATDGMRGGVITENMTGISLAQQVNTPRCWPTATATATATAYKGWSVNHNRASSDDRLDYSVERESHEAGAPGRLNPEWVEWLMGWPLGWTDLKPLAMDRFREWQQQHSPCCLDDKEAA